VPTIVQTVLKNAGNVFKGGNRHHADTYLADADGTPLPVKEIHVPPQAATEPLPLLIGLHGYGSDERQINTLVNLHVEQPYVYLALRAWHHLHDGGYAWFPLTKTDTGIRSAPQDVVGSLERLARFIPRAVQRYHANPHQVFLVGYSQGAVMKLAFTLMYPELMAGAVALSGQIIPELGPFVVHMDRLQRKPVFVGYGTQDHLITAADRHTARQYLLARGLNLTYKEYAIPHVVSATERQDVAQWLRTHLHQ